MEVRKFIGWREQTGWVNGKGWDVERLVELSADLPILQIPLDHLCIAHEFDTLTLQDMVMHIRAVEEADLSYPIILDEDGVIIDGRHRVMKAILLGRKSILAKRFPVNPPHDDEDF